MPMVHWYVIWQCCVDHDLQLQLLGHQLQLCQGIQLWALWRHAQVQHIKISHLIKAFGSLTRIMNREQRIDQKVIQEYSNDIRCLDEFISRIKFYTNIFHFLDNDRTLASSPQTRKRHCMFVDPDLQEKSISTNMKWVLSPGTDLGFWHWVWE